MQLSKSKQYEALLVISTALVVIYLFGLWRHGDPRELFLYLAGGIGLSGILIRPLGRLIALGWYKLAELLNLIMSKVVLSLVYLLILVPVASLQKIWNKDKLRTRQNKETMWRHRNHRYTPEDLKNIW
jgi:hypothetical protein